MASADKKNVICIHLHLFAYKNANAIYLLVNAICFLGWFSKKKVKEDLIWRSKPDVCGDAGEKLEKQMEVRNGKTGTIRQLSERLATLGIMQYACPIEAIPWTPLEHHKMVSKSVMFRSAGSANFFCILLVLMFEEKVSLAESFRPIITNNWTIIWTILCTE